MEDSNYDIHRTAGGIQLILPHRSGVLLFACTETQAAKIVESRKQRGRATFIFVFRLTSASLDVSDMERRYTGTLVDFADLSADSPVK